MQFSVRFDDLFDRLVDSFQVFMQGQEGVGTGFNIRFRFFGWIFRIVHDSEDPPRMLLTEVDSC
jgi:hypothetical protein